MDVLQRANEIQAEGHKVLHCEVGALGVAISC